MGVLGTVVHVTLLGNLVDKEPEEDSEDDSLAERVANHINGFVVDPVDFLHALQVILLGRSVRNRPESQVVHVAEHGPVVLEANGKTLVLQVDVLVLELGHANVVGVGYSLSEVLLRRFKVGELVHFL